MGTAIAVGCLPVVIADPMIGAFPHQAQYASFWIKFPQQAFVRDPMSLVHRLRTIDAAEVAAKLAALHAHRADALYDVADSRVGTHFLMAAANSSCGRHSLNLTAKRP